MLTRDVRLEGFTTDEWRRLGEVFGRPQAGPAPVGPAPVGSAPVGSAAVAPAQAASLAQAALLEQSPPRADNDPALCASGGLIVLTSGRRLLKLLHTERGRQDPHQQSFPAPLSVLADRYGARWAIEIQQGALEDLMERFGERLSPKDELLHQGLKLLAISRELEAEGRITSFPRRISEWPVPSERMLLRAFDALCHVRQVVLVGVFRAGELYTCLAARRAEFGLDWIVGPELLRERMGLLSGDWTRDYRHLLRATEEVVGPVAVGCFGEYATLRKLVTSAEPGEFAQAIAARELVVSPVVPALAVPLGLDVGRAVLSSLRGLAAKLSDRDFSGPSAAFSSALGRFQQILPASVDIPALLGFDPLDLLKKLTSRNSPPD